MASDLPISTKATNSSLKIDNFIQGKFGLSGSYPPIPAEVMSVFFGLFDGKVQSADIQIETGLIGAYTHEAWFASLPAVLQALLLIYCVYYAQDLGSQIASLICDVTVFELPSITTPKMNPKLKAEFDIQKVKLDGVLTKMKDELDELLSVPADKMSSKTKSNIDSQITNLDKIEELLKKLMEFVNNPLDPLAAKIAPYMDTFNKGLQKVNDVYAQIKDGAAAMKASGDAILNIDFEALAAKNDSIFSSMNNQVESSVSQVKASASASVDFLDKTRTEVSKMNPAAAKAWVSAKMKEKDIDALCVSASNVIHIEDLRAVSLTYKQKLKDFESMSSGGISGISPSPDPIKLKKAVIETERVSDCIRIFKKMTTVKDGVKNVYLGQLSGFFKSECPSMTIDQNNMMTKAVGNSMPSQAEMLKNNSTDRLDSLASTIKSETNSVNTVLASSQTFTSKK